jgi:hypothetical protein
MRRLHVFTLVLVMAVLIFSTGMAAESDQFADHDRLMAKMDKLIFDKVDLKKRPSMRLFST